MLGTDFHPSSRSNMSRSKVEKKEKLPVFSETIKITDIKSPENIIFKCDLHSRSASKVNKRSLPVFLETQC